LKPDRKLSYSDSAAILRQCKYGILSTSTLDGVPYGVPVNYFYVPDDNAIYFHCAIKGRKIDNIITNNNVSFVVVGKEMIIEDRFSTQYESVIVTGTASLITDNEEKRSKLVQLCEELTPAAEGRDEFILKYLPSTTIVKITINDISGKKNQAN